MKYWYKNAIIYSLNVSTFKDGDNDGVGDFAGLKEKLEYISGLGVNTIWLLPIFSTPDMDNGYDVSDYYTINSCNGEMADFVEFLDFCEDHNLRVIIDLPLNHTSNQHRWFQQACKDPDSKYRDYYIWSKEKPDESKQKIMFAGEQESNWAYDEHSDSYYYHSFYHFQPDLNYSNPQVRKEIRRIMHFWLRLGVSGFRVDALPHVIRPKGHVNLEEPEKILQELRQNVEEVRHDAVLLGESDVEPDRYKYFFGEVNRFHMLLNFYLTNYLFLALAKQDKTVIEYAWKMLPNMNISSQFANFLRNHDELNLNKLSEEEMQVVYEKFAPEERMLIFNRGIRRRISPMLGSVKKVKFAHSLLFSMPGIPVIRYGDELGMGEDLDKEGRSSVNTTMHWSPGVNGGFSNVPESEVCETSIKEGEFSYKKINVEDQQRDFNSLMHWLQMLIRVRTKCMELGRGNFQFLETQQPEILAQMSKMDNEISVVMHNFSDKKIEAEVKLEHDNIKDFYEVFYDEPYERFDPNKPVTLNGWGFRWFKGKLKSIVNGK